MSISRRSILSSAALAVVSTAIPSPSRAGEFLRLSSFFAREHFITQQVLQPFADELLKQGIEVSIYPAGELARDPMDQLQLIDAGVADLALVVPTIAPARFPETSFISLPNLIPDATTGSRLLTRMYFERSKALSFEFGDTLPIAYFATPPYFLHSRIEIRTLSDFSGLKVRVPNMEMAQTLGALGATSVTLPGGELVTAGSVGVVDAAALSFDQYRALSAFDVFPFSIDLNLGGSSAALLVMKRSRLDFFPDYLREPILEASGERLSENWGAAYDREAPSRSNIIPLEGDAATKFAEVAQRAQESWAAAGFDRSFILNQAKSILEDLTPRI